VPLKRNETLWRMIRKVYGVEDSNIIASQYLTSVKLANPYISNPDHVIPGQLILLPAIPMTVTPLPKDVWWVELQEKDRLEAAMDVLRAYPVESPPIRLIPFWNRQQGLKFAVLFKEYFFDEVSARNRLSSLPPELASKGRILSRWDEDTVFYSDPFAR